MADCVSPFLDIVTRLWDCTANRTVYICDLQDNLNTLTDLKHDLEAISKDLAEQQQIQQYATHTDQVKGWLERVQHKLKEVDAILQKGNEEIQQKCLGSCCPRHCCTSDKIGKQVSKEIDVVKELVNKGHFDVVADNVSRPIIVEMPMERPMIVEMPMEKTVGMESSLDDVWKCVEDHKARIIGLYGMGGVGKTTLLKKLGIRFLETNHTFDVVIWVTVSRVMNLKKIQEIILEQLNMSYAIWENEDERAAQLLKILRNKRFVLLLDDLWDRLELSKLGVPFLINQNRFKIVFTTRSEEVCGMMEADVSFKLNGLSKKAALELFQRIVGEDVLNSHSELPKLAKIVAQMCDGLPLALVASGRVMASKTTPEDWMYAIEMSKSNSSDSTVMGEYIFPALSISYDSLSDDRLKYCFLYCSIFPKDHDISNRELIELWIGEGFLDYSDNMYDARVEGRNIIESLKRHCLLEQGMSYKGGDHVKMQNVHRDMAHWLARRPGNEILVKEHAGLINSHEIRRWKEAVRVSLYGDSTEFLIETPVVCPCLKTIFVMGSTLTTLPGTLFQSIHTMTVLNLSNNKDLKELPVEIGALFCLRYLNLSKTCVSDLPIEVKNLTRLRILLLDDMLNHIVIPPVVISSLSSLEMYSSIEHFHPCKIDPESIIEELECLEKITDVGLTFPNVSPVLKFMSSPKLQSCITRLSIHECEEFSSLDIISYSSMRKMEHLEELYIRDCPNLREVKICFEPNRFCNLQILKIWNCAMENLTWLRYTPRLGILDVIECELLEEIIASNFGSSEIEEDVEIFSNLKTVYFQDLPKLKSICRPAMPFPSLLDISVHYCPSLRKLPFNAESAKSLKEIKGNRDWWNKLEWADEATNLAFTSKFQLN